jgi:acetyl-CoA acyltransferase
MKEAVIVSIARTAVGKAPRGTLRSTRPDDMAAAVFKEVISRVPGLDVNEIEDVVLGCAMPEGEQGYNVARTATLRAGLPVTCPAITINRFCSSGLQAIALASERIMAGFGKVMIAGGSESMSLIPMGGFHFSPNPYLMEHYPDSYLSMGLTAENLAHKYRITREQADQFSLRSHQRAIAAIEEGRFKDEIVPLEVVEVSMSGNSRPEKRTLIFSVDEGPRRDTTMEALAKLKPAFHAHGTVTAGNSSQMSDGAAAAIVMSAERARELGVRPLARFVAYAAAGTLPEEMGVGPVYAIPKVLKLAGLKLADIDVIELNEAFAAQALAVIQEAGLDLERVNVNGGAVALGHPLGCSGAKLTATLLGEMKRRKSRYGMVTMCVGGGMGAAGIFENLQGDAGLWERRARAVREEWDSDEQMARLRELTEKLEETTRGLRKEKERELVGSPHDSSH